MERALIAVSRIFAYLAATALVVLMLAIVLDVGIRLITGASVPGVLEIAETSLVAAAFLGAAWTGLQGGHIDVDALTEKMPPRVERIVLSIIWALSVGTLVWLTVAATVRALYATSVQESRFGLLEWPLYPTRWVIVVGLALWTLVAVANFVRAIRGRALFGGGTSAPAAL